ncbi:hypothetical protein [Scytonema sp. PCC 10023]|uniref:hypothetical protein n=1 Tax=Scytonema sp. PCC 10023 TaxID=1680591 RepID=UPI0039C685FF
MPEIANYAKPLTKHNGMRSQSRRSLDIQVYLALIHFDTGLLQLTKIRKQPQN